ncbi:DUF4145 domain-containing protein [Lysinibacillus yapensis]|nr:DUF4145 domain-containing protein [Lysinibacillus yapensis]
MQQIPSEHLPSFHRDAFHCPRCKVLVPQKWYKLERSYPHNENVELVEVNLKSENRKPIGGPMGGIRNPDGSEPNFHFDWHLELSYCTHCHNYTIWENKKIIFPYTTELPQPHEDMLEDVRGIYIEAMNVFKHSPRAAAALLRLAIELMIPQLEDYQIKKSSINNMIGELVQKDIPEHVQQGLDSIRVYGNEGIHPGEIDLTDDESIVLFLFELINIMVEELITKKKKIKSFYENLPQGKLQGIFQRDKRKQEK